MRSSAYHEDGRFEDTWRGLRLVLSEPRLVLAAFHHRSRQEIYQEYLRLRSEREPWRSIKARILNKPNQTFQFQGEEYRYEYHERNQTWLGERGVELALGSRFLTLFADQRILEVGNVLSQYFPRPADSTVVDKYEKGPGILNADIIDYAPKEGFDVILSVSTLEHVGWDELPRTPQKFSSAVQRLHRLLKPGGRVLATVPIGYNAYVDRLLESGKHGFDRVSFLKRISWDNTWQEVSQPALRGVAYGSPSKIAAILQGDPYPSANAIAVCQIDAGPGANPPVGA